MKVVRCAAAALQSSSDSRSYVVQHQTGWTAVELARLKRLCIVAASWRGKMSRCFSLPTICCDGLERLVLANLLASAKSAKLNAAGGGCSSGETIPHPMKADIGTLPFGGLLQPPRNEPSAWFDGGEPGTGPTRPAACSTLFSRGPAETRRVPWPVMQ